MLPHQAKGEAQRSPGYRLEHPALYISEPRNSFAKPMTCHTPDVVYLGVLAYLDSVRNRTESNIPKSRHNMATKRKFTPDEMPKKSKDYHGTVKYDHLAIGNKSTHIYLTFAEAVKFSLYVQSCVLEINTLNRKKGQPGRNIGMSLALKSESKSLSVIQKQMKSTH
jgi:hypothetical protein